MPLASDPDRPIQVALESPCYRSYHDAVYGWRLKPGPAGATVRLELAQIERLDGGDRVLG